MTILILTQGAKTGPTQRGLLIGSYRQHMPASPPTLAGTPFAATANTDSMMSGRADGKHAVPPLSPLSSRPSSVSANHRYASTLATEESSFCSEPGSVAESAAELVWDESLGLGQEAADEAAGSSNHRGVPGRHPPAKLKKNGSSAVRRAEAAAGRAEAVKRKAGPLPPKADLAPQMGSTQRCQPRTQMHNQHLCHPLTPPQQLRPGQPLVLPLNQQIPLAVEDEEAWLPSPLQKLDSQLSTTQMHCSASKPALPQHAFHAQHAQQSSSGTVPSSAHHSRRHASVSTRQKSPKARPAEDSNKAPPVPSTPDGQAGPSTKAAAKGQARRAAGLARGQVDMQACLSDSTARHDSVAVTQGSSATSNSRVKAPARARNASRTGAGHKLSQGASNEADITNSLEQQLLQQSLAKLDARLTSLAARGAGMQHTCTVTVLGEYFSCA